MPEPAQVSVDAVMADLQTRLREEIRAELVRRGASPAFTDADLFADVDGILRGAASQSHPSLLLLPHILGDPARWRLETAMRYSTHRGGAAGALRLFVKQRVLMPIVRWLFEYSRDNFERQRHVNQILFACVQELAIETARLRQEVRRLSGS